MERNKKKVITDEKVKTPVPPQIEYPTENPESKKNQAHQPGNTKK